MSDQPESSHLKTVGQRLLRLSHRMIHDADHSRRPRDAYGSACLPHKILKELKAKLMHCQ